MKKIIYILSIMLLTVYCNAYADTDVTVTHKMGINNISCHAVVKNNDEVVIDRNCTKTIFNVMSDESAILEFYDVSGKPFIVRVLPNKKYNDDDVVFDVESMLVGDEIFKVEGKCIGNTKTSSFKCNILNIDESGKVEINLESSGGSKYLIK